MTRPFSGPEWRTYTLEPRYRQATRIRVVSPPDPGTPLYIGGPPPRESIWTSPPSALTAIAAVMILLMAAVVQLWSLGVRLP